MATGTTSSKTLKKEKIDTERGVEVETLLLWKAPSRPYRERDKEFFSTVGAIAFLVIVVLVFLKEWFLIILIIALLFFLYILSTVPPGEVEHQITNKGIQTGERTYLWHELGDFWFSEEWGQKTLNIFTPFFPSGRLTLLLGNQKEEVLRKVLLRFLRHEEPQPTFVEKASEWLAKRIPLEKLPKTSTKTSASKNK